MTLGVNMRRKPQIKSRRLIELKAECAAWNAKNHVGALVKYWPIAGVDKWETRTTASEAYVLAGHTAVVELTGKYGHVALGYCEAYPPAPDFRALLN